MNCNYNDYDYRKIDDKLLDIEVGPSGSLLNLNYNYDQVGNITQINNDYYNYDNMNRLTWEGDLPYNPSNIAIATGTNWLYDGAGNMSTRTSYQNGQNQPSIAYSCDRANRLNSMGTASLSYDSYGDCTQKISSNNTWGYSYDGEDQLPESLPRTGRKSIPTLTTIPECGSTGQ